MSNAAPREVPLFHVDAFADAVFAGNPAAVCPLEAWLPEAEMRAISAENNLSETAFFVPAGDHYDLRWFTPTAEVELCGHATLAAAWVVLDRLAPETGSVRFSTRSGVLTVSRSGALLILDLPALPAEPAAAPARLAEGLGAAPASVLRASNYMAVFDDHDAVRGLAPDMAAIASLHPFGVIATAPGEAGGDVDFVSRYFAPSYGIPEDPVTGSAHCTLVPYWSRRLGKKTLQARQVSARGGALACEDRGARVALGGRAVLYMEGTIRL